MPRSAFGRTVVRPRPVPARKSRGRPGRSLPRSGKTRLGRSDRKGPAGRHASGLGSAERLARRPVVDTDGRRGRPQPDRARRAERRTALVERGSPAPAARRDRREVPLRGRGGDAAGPVRRPAGHPRRRGPERDRPRRRRPGDVRHPDHHDQDPRALPVRRRDAHHAVRVHRQHGDAVRHGRRQRAAGGDPHGARRGRQGSSPGAQVRGDRRRGLGRRRARRVRARVRGSRPRSSSRPFTGRGRWRSGRRRSPSRSPR